MEQSDTLTVRSVPRKDVAQACYHALNLIGRNCEYLEQHLVRTGADKATRQAVTDIGAANAQLDRTVNEVMALLEYLGSEEIPDLRPVDLCQLLQQLASQADIIKAQLKVELLLDCGGWTACRVMAQRSDAELLLLHLLSNALRACEEGGKVQILLRRTETFWQLSILDNGCGLPDGSESSLLENRRRFLGGAKLGLLLCRECCRRMGWGLQVKNAPEGGVVSLVTIPLSTDRAAIQAMELRSDNEAQCARDQYRLRAMLVRELCTMPERGDPDEL